MSRLPATGSDDPGSAALGPDGAERLARARADLRIGLPVALATGDGTWLALAAETLTPARFALLPRDGLTLAVTDWRAETLKARAYDGDLARIRVPAEAGVAWIAAVADPATDLATPMKGPFDSARGGDALPHRAALRLAKAARLLPAVLVARWEGALPDGVTMLPVETVAGFLDREVTLRQVAGARVPTAFASAGRLRVFRPALGGDEHVSVEIGRPGADRPPLVRLHSACFTGDVLGSLKCDCGPQLHAALRMIAAEGAGVLLYLGQEGRGIGLANKLRAYGLQDQGFDTVEANHRLGFEDDERDFRIGAAMLRALGRERVRLLTNNPAKVAMLERSGIEVTERVPLRAGQTDENAAYLATKARKSGHLL